MVGVENCRQAPLFPEARVGSRKWGVKAFATCEFRVCVCKVREVERELGKVKISTREEWRP